MRLHAILLGTALAAALALPAMARECPTHVQKIDEALASADLSQEQKAEVQRLRDEGQELHNQGQHDASMEKLTEAEKILGI